MLTYTFFNTSVYITSNQIDYSYYTEFNDITP